jgi:hypothetical protein
VNSRNGAALGRSINVRTDMTTLPKAGTKVTWNTAQGETHGIVEKTVTSTTQVKGYVAKATKEHPQVLVKSEKSGKEAVHKPEQLKKTGKH